MKNTLEELRKIFMTNRQTWTLVAMMALVPSFALAEDAPEEVDAPPLDAEMLPEDWCTPFDGICDEPCLLPETHEVFIDDDCLYEDEDIHREDDDETEEPFDEAFEEADVEDESEEVLDEQWADEEPLDEGEFEEDLTEEPMDEGIVDDTLGGTEDEYFDDEGIEDDYLGEDAPIDDGTYPEATPEDPADFSTQHSVDINVNGDFGELGGCSATNPVPLLACMSLIPWLVRRRRRMKN